MASTPKRTELSAAIGDSCSSKLATTFCTCLAYLMRSSTSGSVEGYWGSVSWATVDDDLTWRGTNFKYTVYPLK